MGYTVPRTDVMRAASVRSAEAQVDRMHYNASRVRRRGKEN